MAGRTSRALIEFDVALARMPLPGAAGKLFARLDAVHSSGAEGCTTTFTELLGYQSSLGTARDESDAATVAACSAAFADADVEDFGPLVAVRAIHWRLFERSTAPMVAAKAGLLDIPNDARRDRL